MSGLYLVAIIVSAAGMLTIDARWRLFFWRDHRAAALVTLVGVLVMLAWDAAGIALGIFRLGDGPALLGIDIAPHLPIEEIAFLTFLVICTMVLYCAAARVVAHLGARHRDRTGDRPA